MGLDWIIENNTDEEYDGEFYYRGKIISYYHEEGLIDEKTVELGYGDTIDIVNDKLYYISKKDASKIVVSLKKITFDVEEDKDKLQEALLIC